MRRGGQKPVVSDMGSIEKNPEVGHEAVEESVLYSRAMKAMGDHNFGGVQVKPSKKKEDLDDN